MWTSLKGLFTSRLLWQRLALATGGVMLLVLGFCFGRWSYLSQAFATTPPQAVTSIPVRNVTTDEYSRRPVAYIHNSIPITREDLGEYLIARFGPERVEFLVNRRIIEQACTAGGVTVTDAEVEAQLIEDLKAMNIVRLQDFVNNVLKRFNKTLYEYKEDVIRPKLALSKFCRQNVKVEPMDLQMAFEAKYGAKVECRMIVLSKDQGRHKFDIHGEVARSEEKFNHYARTQFVGPLAAKGGEMPPIHKHFGDKRIEDEAFSLKPGEVSKLIDMPDGTAVILKCVKHLPPDNTRRFEEVRLKLQEEVYEIKLAQEIPRVFQELRKRADPKIFLKRDSMSQELERHVNTMLSPTAQLPAQPVGQRPLQKIEVPPPPPQSSTPVTPVTAPQASAAPMPPLTVPPAPPLEALVPKTN